MIKLVIGLILVLSAIACGTHYDGKDGVNGTDGTNGIDGTNGVDGKDGINSTPTPITVTITRVTNGTYVINCSDTCIIVDDTKKKEPKEKDHDKDD